MTLVTTPWAQGEANWRRGELNLSVRSARAFIPSAAARVLVDWSEEILLRGGCAPPSVWTVIAVVSSNHAKAALRAVRFGQGRVS
jgi:hypothetical protein